MNWLDWYHSLAKPSWTPAPATIGLIWQILYPIIAVSFGFVFLQAIRRKAPWLVALPTLGRCRHLDRLVHHRVY